MSPSAVGDFHPVSVNCDCQEFRFSWAEYNKKQKALIGGKVKPYTRKTTTRPDRNPLHTPGVCKHIFALLKALESEGLLI